MGKKPLSKLRVEGFTYVVLSATAVTSHICGLSQSLRETPFWLERCNYGNPWQWCTNLIINLIKCCALWNFVFTLFEVLTFSAWTGQYDDQAIFKALRLRVHKSGNLGLFVECCSETVLTGKHNIIYKTRTNIKSKTQELGQAVLVKVHYKKAFKRDQWLDWPDLLMQIVPESQGPDCKRPFLL